MTNTISVIIPFYNSSDFLLDSVKSVLSQSYHDFEIILVDDGSSDNSLLVAKEISRNDSRIKVFTNKNEGPGKARIFGVEKSVGKYVMFLDSDDFLVNDALEKIANAFVKNNVDAVRFHGRYYPSGKILEKMECEKKIHILSKSDIDAYISMSDKLSSMCFQAYKRELLDGMQIKRKILYCEDYLINQYVYSKNRRILVMKDPLYEYRINEKSTTRNTDDKKIISNISDRLYVCCETLRFIDNSCLDENNKAIARGYQIERIRREITRYFKEYRVKQADVKHILHKEDFYSVLSKIKQNDIDLFVKKIKFTERMKTAKIVKKIYEDDIYAITKYAKICYIYSKMKKWCKII